MCEQLRIISIPIQKCIEDNIMTRNWSKHIVEYINIFHMVFRSLLS